MEDLTGHHETTPPARRFLTATSVVDQRTSHTSRRHWRSAPTEAVIYTRRRQPRQNQGLTFQPFIDSGISLYVWSARRFLAVVIFSCKTFDAESLAGRQPTSSRCPRWRRSRLMRIPHAAACPG
jgi:hypothetical protein